nr:hypothetical protein [Clostridia bacterium]
MSLLFTQVKSQVTARQAAERYGVQVNRSGMACCPFHDDHHPSMKIDERFFCFGCHATGDVIDFTAKLFGLSPYDAAKKLAADFDIHPLPPGQNAPIPKLPAELLERKEEQRVLGLLIDYERLLMKWKEEYAPVMPDKEQTRKVCDAPPQNQRERGEHAQAKRRACEDPETWDERFCQAIRHQIPVGYAIECLISSDPDERKEMMETIRDLDAAAKIENILKNGIPKKQTRRVCDAVPQNQQERGEHAQAQRRACEETEQNAREENHAA